MFSPDDERELVVVVSNAGSDDVGFVVKLLVEASVVIAGEVAAVYVAEVADIKVIRTDSVVEATVL